MAKRRPPYLRDVVEIQSEASDYISCCAPPQPTELDVGKAKNVLRHLRTARSSTSDVGHNMGLSAFPLGRRNRRAPGSFPKTSFAILKKLCSRFSEWHEPLWPIGRWRRGSPPYGGSHTAVEVRNVAEWAVYFSKIVHNCSCWIALSPLV